MDPVSFSVALDGCAAAIALTLACFEFASSSREPFSWSFCGMCAGIILYAVADGAASIIDAHGTVVTELLALEFLGLFALIGCYAWFMRLSAKSFGLVPAAVTFPLVAAVAQILIPVVSVLPVVVSCGLLATLISALPLREAALERAQAELIRARTDVVLSQIQPHFLYNTLTAIRRLCRVDTDRAALMLDDFSGYLRGNMASLTCTEAIPFAEELAHTQKYLELEGLRMGDRLKVGFDIRAVDFDLPALTLQALAENAVRHGISKRPEGGSLRISSYRSGRTCYVSVVDDGVGFDPTRAPQDEPGHERLHVGTESARMRLDRMCSGTLEIQSEPGRGTSVLVGVPARQPAR